MSFGEYLKMLRKDKEISQRELAEQSGISNAEISRIETGERQRISPDVLRSIAPILGIPYEDLMDKAGYISRHSTFMSESREAEEQFISLVTPKLIMDGWSVERSRRGPAIGDVIARKDKEEWHIDFKYIRTRRDDDRHFREAMMVRDISARSYGRLAIYDHGPITKYTLAVNNEKAFDTLIKYPPILLKLSVSVMLLDFENSEIVKEERLT